jgi:2-iminobutanoate/2-iminopropanoate deaminase
VVDCVVYITAARDFDAMNQAYREIFAKDFPARTTVMVEIVIPDPLVEIMLTAVR